MKLAVSQAAAVLPVLPRTLDAKAAPLRLLTPCGPATPAPAPRRAWPLWALGSVGQFNPVRAALLGASFAASLLGAPAEAKTGRPAEPTISVQEAYEQALRTGSREKINALVQSANFRQLDARVQVEALRAIGAHRGSALDTIIRLIAAPGFAALPKADQSRLLRYVGGHNQEVSTPARAALAAMLRSNTFRDANAAGQQQRLASFLKGQGAALVASSVSPAISARYRYSLGRTEVVAGVPFRSGVANGERTFVTIGSQQIAVYLPGSKVRYAGRLPTVDQIAKALAGLPPQTRALIKEVYANPGPNPTNANFEKDFAQADFTSLMTAGANGVVSIYPSRYGSSMNTIDHSMAHESGHVLSFKHFGQNYRGAGWSKWRAAVKADGVYASAYARKSYGEDFAETLVVYLSSKDDPAAHAELRAIFPERFKILDRLLG